MKTAKLGDYTNGWFIGDFDPSILRTKDFEVAHHLYRKGFTAPPHIHKIATEYNYVVRGILTADGRTLGPGDVFIYEPAEVANVTFHDDTDIIIVKVPSVPSDKYVLRDSIWRHKKKVFSQNGEDGIIEYVFGRLDESDIPYNRFCVEFGAWDGVTASNTRNLILNGWKSIQIECGEQYESLMKNYEGIPGVTCLNRRIEPTGANSYDAIIKDYLGGKNISFLSIDVDSNDYDIFRGLSTRPLLVSVENNSYQDAHKNEGITTFSRTAKEMGYSLICCVWNLLFLRSDLVGVLGYPEISPKDAWDGHLDHISKKNLDWIEKYVPQRYWER